MTDKTGIIEVEGEVTETLPNMMFRVLATKGPEEIIGKTLLCTLAGKMRMYRIKVLLGDFVKLEVSKYDLAKGRITFRMREQPVQQAPQQAPQQGPGEEGPQQGTAV